MSNRTVIALAAIAAALFVFIYFADRDGMTTSEIESRKDRVFPEIKSGDIDKIAVTGSSGERVSLVRTRGTGEGAAESSWTIDAPKKLSADPSAVEEILSAIDFAVRKRTVVGAGERSKPQYGLEKPRATVTFEARKKTFSFRVGTGKGAADTVYVAVDGRENELYAVEADFGDSIDKGLDDLRDKHLLGEVSGSVVGVEIARGGETVGLSRVDENAPWTISRGGASLLAAADQVTNFVNDVRELRAEAFVADGVSGAALASYGLDAPIVRVGLRTDKGAAKELLLGKACAKEGQLYAVVAGEGTVACVGDDIAASAGRPAARLVETKPLVFTDDEIEKISLTRGTTSTAFERDEEKGWILSGKKDMSVDLEAITHLLETIRETRAVEVSTDPAMAASVNGAPDLKIVLSREAGAEPLELALFAEGAAGKQRARRGKEAGVLVFDKDLLALLPAEAFAYRGKTLENADIAEAVSLVIEGPSPQKLVQTDGVWKLEAPAGLEADVASARTAAELVAQTKVVRFAAASALPEHGFASPWARATAVFAAKPQEGGEKGATSTKEKKVTLELGAPSGADGARFARLEGSDGTVFVLDKSSVELLAKPLVSRDLLAVETTDLAKVVFSAKGASLVAVREGDGWKTETAGVDGAELDRRMGELGVLRAIRGEAFGPADPAFASPALTVEAWTKKQLDGGGKPTVIQFGAKALGAEDGAYTARKEGVDVTLLVPGRLVDEILALIPAASAPGAP